MTSQSSLTSPNAQLAKSIKQWGKALGFADVGITHYDLSEYEPHFFKSLADGLFADMTFMGKHGTKRTRPNELVPGTLSLISVRMNYFDLSAEDALLQLHASQKAYISRYALGKDYHKLMRKRLQQLAQKIQQQVPELQYRAFSDSAPVLEQAIAQKSGIGFIGKNSLVIHPQAGSWFFLGELYLNQALPSDPPFTKQGCGPCRACIDECPTQAILSDNRVDAARCISYLTIENDGIIPEEFRSAIGNRIYGCDDCQLVCPWNRYAEPSKEAAFASQYQLDNATLLELWQWSESQFLEHFKGSAIRRIGYEKWQRNLAVAIGNIQSPKEIKAALAIFTNTQNRSELVQTHINWAIEQLTGRLKNHTNSWASQANLENFDNNRPKPFFAKKYYYPAEKIRRLQQQT